MKWITIKKTIISVKETIRLLIKCHPTLFVTIIIMSILSGVPVPVTSYLWKVFLDKLSTGEAQLFAELVLILIIYAFFNFMSVLLSNIMGYYSSVYTNYISKHVSTTILEKAYSIDYHNYENSDIYNLIQKAHEETEQYAIVVLNQFSRLISTVTTFLGLLGIFSIFNNVSVLLIILGTIPTFFVSLKMSDKLYKLFELLVEDTRYAKFITFFSLKNENIKEIKVYQTKNFFLNIIKKIHNRKIVEYKKLMQKSTVYNTLTEILLTVIVVSVQIMILYKSLTTQLSIGTAALLISSVSVIQNSLLSMLSIFNTLYESSFYMDNFFALQKIETKKESGKPRLKTIKYLTVKNVSYKYSERTTMTLENINVSFRQGCKYAIIGENGSGKSTFLKIISSLYKPTHGEILINNLDHQEYNLESVFENMSILFQDFSKYPLSVYDNIVFGDNNIVIYEKVMLLSKEYKFSDFINELPFGFESQLGKEWYQGTDISGGQWQKIGLLRALQRTCSLLILDEPTSAIDNYSQQLIFQNLDVLCKNKILILITHEVEYLKKMDEILVFKKGKIIERGTHLDLLENGKEYRKITISKK